MNTSQRIDEFIDAHRQDMVALLSRLSEIPSVLDKAEEGMPFGRGIDCVLRLAAKEARALGLQVRDYEGMAELVTLNGKEPALAILSHVDVVPADAEGWSTPPFTPTVRGDFIYGRGVSDNKGPCVAALYALHAVKSLGIPLTSDVLLYLGGCEENGQRDLKRYLQENRLPPYVFTPDGCFPVHNAERGRILITCHTDFDSPFIVSASAGAVINAIPDEAEATLRHVPQEQLRALADKVGVPYTLTMQEQLIHVVFHGKSTHAAHPHQGVNALTALLTVLGQLESKLAPLAACYPHGAFKGEGLGLRGGIDISLTQLRVGEGRLFFGSDGRTDLQSSAQEMASTIRRTLPYPIDITATDAHRVDANADVVKRLNSVYEAHTGKPGGAYTLDAMTYAHHTENGVIFGGVIWGDGSGGAHSKNERYSLNSLCESAKIFAKVIVNICE